MADMVEIVRGDLNLLQRTLICAMMVIDVHARDVNEMLVNNKICAIDDFNWMKQLRYYYERELEDFSTRMTNTYFLYSDQTRSITEILVRV
jgi:dynein heavy chain, axonemal